MEETGAAIVDELVSIADEEIEMVLPASGDDVIFLGNGIFSWKRYCVYCKKMTISGVLYVKLFRSRGDEAVLLSENYKGTLQLLTMNS